MIREKWDNLWCLGVKRAASLESAGDVTVTLILPVKAAEEAPTLSCGEGEEGGTVAEDY